MNDGNKSTMVASCILQNIVQQQSTELLGASTTTPEAATMRMIMTVILPIVAAIGRTVADCVADVNIEPLGASCNLYLLVLFNNNIFPKETLLLVQQKI